MKLFSKLNLLTLALGGVLVLSVPAVKADTTTDTSQQSTATLNIQDESSDTTAKLSLDAVPSFPFGTVKASTIFAGGSVDADLSSNNTVVINDTRLSSVGWNLAVTNTTAFTNGNSKINGTVSFTPAAFQFSDGAAEGWAWANSTTSLALPNSTSNQVATSTGAKKGTATSEIKHASLKFNGHDAIVPGSYTANLTWNLAAATTDSSTESE